MKRVESRAVHLRSLADMPPDVFSRESECSSRFSPLEPETASQPVTDDMYPARRVAFPGGVTGMPDLTYGKYSGYRPLTLDLYLPPASMRKPESGFPLVVYIHGGGWISGHSRQAGAFANFPEVLASLAGRGYVTASVNYRLCHEAGFPAAVMDIKTAIRWLRSKAGGFGLDPERAAVWGGSAGGQIAALVAVTGGLEAFDPARPAFDREGRPISGFLPAEVICQSDCVQAAAAWYGVFDFAAMFRQAGFMEGAPAPGAHGVFTYLGFDPSNRRPEILEAASCTTYIDRNTPPMLLIHGVEDTIVPYRQSEDMAAKLKKAGVPAELILIPGVGHSFLGGSPDQIHEASLTALHATIGFFDKTIGPCK